RVERIVVARVEGEEVGARAAEARIVDAVRPNRALDAAVLVDLLAEGAGGAVARPRRVERGRAARDRVIVARAGGTADVPVEALEEAAARELALEQVPRARIGGHDVARRGEAGLQDVVC